MDIDLKHPLIKKANSVSSDEIQEAAGIPPILRLKDQTFSCKICHAQELPNELREQLWLLFEENMRTFYAQAPSFSWDPEEKKEEMFHALSRVVLLQPIQLDEGLQSPGASESPVVAFSMFRFEREDKRNMLYCYELQVRISARRSGLGKALLDVLGKIGKAYSMPRILLTAFTANQSAFRFYEASGFVTDVTSPSLDEEDDPDTPPIEDYVILCKEVGR